jgi:hypothetical protein
MLGDRLNVLADRQHGLLDYIEKIKLRQEEWILLQEEFNLRQQKFEIEALLCLTTMKQNKEAAEQAVKPKRNFVSDPKGSPTTKVADHAK